MRCCWKSALEDYLIIYFKQTKWKMMKIECQEIQKRFFSDSCMLKMYKEIPSLFSFALAIGNLIIYITAEDILQKTREKNY